MRGHIWGGYPLITEPPILSVRPKHPPQPFLDAWPFARYGFDYSLEPDPDNYNHCFRHHRYSAQPFHPMAGSQSLENVATLQQLSRSP